MSALPPSGAYAEISEILNEHGDEQQQRRLDRVEHHWEAREAFNFAVVGGFGISTSTVSSDERST